MSVILARAPTRIDFGGGWTDVPPYAQEEGGFVCNVAISRCSTVRLSPRLPSDAADASHGEQALAEAALRVSRLPYLRAHIHNDFPLGAGLGGSSAAGVAMMGALEAWRTLASAGGSDADPTRQPVHEALEHFSFPAKADRRLMDAIPADRAALAEASRRVEVDELHVAGGRQDHYAAAFGGALALTFGNGTTVQRLTLARPFVRALEARCLVVYTGQSRISGETITAVLDAYRAREDRVLRALARMKVLAEAMADALLAEDLDALGMLVGEHWTHQRALHPAITTPRIDRILDVASAAGAIGGKALGASGGGCVLLVAARGFEEPVRRAVEELGTTIPFTIDQQGFTWWPAGDEHASLMDPSLHPSSA